MSFMEAQMTDALIWFVIEGEEGSTTAPADSTLRFEALTSSNGKARVMCDHYEGYNVKSVSIVRGFGVRLSAPGYMDCTEWEVFANKKDAEKRYQEMREENGEGSE